MPPLPSDLLQGLYICESPAFRDEYYIREMPDGTVVWVGEHVPPAVATSAPSAPPEFTNVFLGRRIRTGLCGEIVDVPKGRARNIFKNVLVGLDSRRPVGWINFSLPGLGYRLLTLSARSAGRVARREWLSGFGGSAPTFLTGDYLTGVWSGDDGGTYYIHQYGLRVVWFGEQLDATGWANVFFGRITGTTLSGQWFDVPKGSASGNGTLDLTVTSPTQLDRSGTGGGYGGRQWNKVP